ncbi:hypothetical protein Trydic_g22574 [Trypoxylus dichotomus]
MGSENRKMFPADSAAFYNRTNKNVNKNRSAKIFNPNRRYNGDINKTNKCEKPEHCLNIEQANMVSSEEQDMRVTFLTATLTEQDEEGDSDANGQYQSLLDKPTERKFNEYLNRKYSAKFSAELKKNCRPQESQQT